MSPPPLPDLGSRFVVDELLAETPFERSYRAHDRVLQRDVLLKLPARGAFAGWSAPVQERLLREARALAKVRSEHVTPIHWVEPTADGPVLVFDLPAGEPLAERLRRGTLAVDEVVALGVQIGRALAQVHLQGVVHRAVGPASIRLMANGRAQLGAFTFAKEFGVRGQVSSLSHAPVGDAPRSEHLPDYSAPEQLAGQAADPRADVYALGCTLFRCLVGHDPFPPGTPAGVLPDLLKLRPDAGRGLADVVRKCTLFAKTARYATAQEVVDALAALQAQPAVGGASRRAWLAAAAVGVVGLGAWGTRGLWAGVDGGGDEFGLRARQTTIYRSDYQALRGLFIGIGAAYDGRQWPKLGNPRREIEAVTAQLQRNDPRWAVPGAIVPLLDQDATLESILAQLRRLEQEADEDDAVLVYFAGHGARQDDSFGLVAADARQPIEIGTGYVRRELLTSFLKRCRAKHVLVVLDCCHSGAVFDRFRGRGIEEDTQPGSHRMRRFSREFLCSAGAGQPAADGADLSPFCAALLHELRQPATADRPYVAACHLAGRIGEAMERAGKRGGMQLPEFQPDVRDGGSFVFRLAAAK
ncbi:MAG: caspase family protein [Planctomycetes bacterium]|nr:caspase family protein [Planctomycetota bacterium]